jgi:hypothetical protein
VRRRNTQPCILLEKSTQASIQISVAQSSSLGIKPSFPWYLNLSGSAGKFEETRKNIRSFSFPTLLECGLGRPLSSDFPAVQYTRFAPCYSFFRPAAELPVRFN